MRQTEEELTGGNASGRVVRVGATVRKPWVDNTSAVQGYLAALNSRGVDTPRPLGRSEDGRQVVEYVEGSIAMSLLPLDATALGRIGEIIRRIHDASEPILLSDPHDWNMLLPADDPDLMCHNDLAPWNLVIGDRWVFIDWDGAGPSTRLWDLAYAAQAFAMVNDGEAVDAAAARLRAFIAGYGADAGIRAALPATMARRTEAMHQLLQSANETGFQPWADMYLNGHGDFWRTTAEYVATNQQAWERALSQAE
jgi:tRNA A-37 threonylcarbamoyl transferase component Bud32